MTPILSAMAAGYGEEEILNYLSEAAPKLKPQIKKAQQAGYTISNILKFLSNTMAPTEVDRNLSQSKAHGLQTERQNQVTHGLLKTVATTFAGGAAVKALGASKPVQALLSKLQKQKPASEIPSSTPAAPQDARVISLEQAKRMTPEFKKYAEEKMQQGLEKPFDELMKDFQRDQKKKGTLTESIYGDVEKMKPTISKDEFVSLPSGDVGRVQDIKKTEALVEEGGKLHRVKINDLESLTQKYKNVNIDVSHIPEPERSAPLYGIRTANDNKNLIVEFFPRNEDVADDEYEYFRKDGKPFDPDILQRLQEGLDIPVTSGVEWAGFWNSEKADSRGSANHHEIKMKAQSLDDVKSGKESADPSKPYWFLRKKSLFRHGYEREARKQFGKHAKGFRKEYRQLQEDSENG